MITYFNPSKVVYALALTLAMGLSLGVSPAYSAGEINTGYFGGVAIRGLRSGGLFHRATGGRGVGGVCL